MFLTQMVTSDNSGYATHAMDIGPPKRISYIQGPTFWSLYYFQDHLPLLLNGDGSPEPAPRSCLWVVARIAGEEYFGSDHICPNFRHNPVSSVKASLARRLIILQCFPLLYMNFQLPISGCSALRNHESWYGGYLWISAPLSSCSTFAGPKLSLMWICHFQALHFPYEFVIFLWS